MHPINNRNFGTGVGKLAVKFHDGSSVVTGYVVKQTGTKKFKVSNMAGTVTKVCTLAQTTDEITALSTGPNTLCTIEIVKYVDGGGGDVTENIKGFLGEGKTVTVQDSVLKLTRGVAADADGEGTIALVANSAPVVANAIPDQAATEEGTFTYVVPADTFADYNGDTVTYTATLANDDPLPAWITFTAGTRTFNSTEVAVAGTYSFKVTADDGTATVSDTFDLVVANVAPIVANPIPDQVASDGGTFDFTFAANTFYDFGTLTYTATLANDDPLPGWLTFTAGTRNFSAGTVGAAATYSIKVTADDGIDTVSDTFDIVVS